MNIRAFICIGCTLIFTFNALADRVGVRKAWVRKFSSQSLSIQSDNLGHIVAMGTRFDANGDAASAPFAVFLNQRGRVIGRREIPPGQVAVDQEGRFFFMSQGPDTNHVRCVAFAPLLKEKLWKQDKLVSNAIAPRSVVRIVDTVADEMGGAWLLGSLSGDFNTGFFLASFGSDQPPLYWTVPRDNRGRSAIQIVRAPNGNVFGICVSTGLGKYSRPEIISCSPGAAELGIRFLYPPPLGSYWPNSAACDADSNLILAGTYNQDVWTYPWRSIVEKFRADGAMGWVQTGLSNRSHLVVTDYKRNVIVSELRRLVKYSAEGAQLWELPNMGTTLRLDERLEVDGLGNIFVCRPGTNEHGFLGPELIKVNADGLLQWQMFVHDGEPRDQYFAGLVIGDERTVYVGLLDGQQTTIVKLVEHPRRPPALLNKPVKPSRDRPELTGGQRRTPMTKQQD